MPGPSRPVLRSDSKQVRDIVTFRHALTGAAATSALLGAGAAPAAAAPIETADAIPDKLERVYNRYHDKVRKLGGEPGRDLVDDGVRKGSRARAARPADVRRSLRVLKRMERSLTAPAPVAAPASATAAAPAASGSASTTTPASSGAPNGSLGAIAACESGGNPSAVGGGGTYRGKYQFDQQTWESVGGSGDPAAAPESEQDARAAQLYAQRGASAWPTCGR